MAIALVQTKTATSGASNLDTLNVVLDAAPTLGNVVFLCVSTGGGGARIASDSHITWMAGTPYFGPSSTFMFPFIGIVKTSSASATITVSSSSSNSLVIAAAEFSGISPIADRIKYDQQFSTAPDTGSTPTTTTANQLWLGFFAHRFANGTTFSAPTNSFTIAAQAKSSLNTTSDRSVALAYKIVTATGAAGVGLTADNGTWVAEMITFPEPSGGGGGTTVIIIEED